MFRRQRSRVFLASAVLLAAISARGADGPVPSFSFDGRVPSNRIVRACKDVLGYLGLGLPERLSPTVEEELFRRGIDVTQLTYFGEGGMGSVSFGGVVTRDGKKKLVVVKEARGNRESNTAALVREHELMKATGLIESTLVRARDGKVTLVMEAVADPAVPDNLAPNLAARMPADSRFAPQPEYRKPEYIQKTALEVLDDLVKIHDAGYVHGDVKPTNVALGDRARLIDFGTAAKVGHQHPAGRLVGTPSYMDTEAMRNLPMTRRRDVRGAQRVLQEMYWQSMFQGMRIGDPRGFVRRQLHPMAFWFELGVTPEGGAGGVKAEVAWVLTTAAFADARELREWLVNAEKSTSFPDFMKDFAKLWERAWKDAEKEPNFAVRRQRLQDLTDDIARKPVYGPSLVAKLDVATRTALLAEARAFRAHNRATPVEYPPEGYHRDIDPSWLAALAP